MDERTVKLNELLKRASETHHGASFFALGPDPELEALEALSDGLGVMASIQSVVSPELTPGLFADDGGLTKEGVAVVAAALQVELGEFINELDWKPWKKHSVDREAVVEEFADIMAFLGLLMLHLEARYGIAVEDLADAYLTKSVKNVDRANGRSGEEGYGMR